jgi:hypothetical protein
VLKIAFHMASLLFSEVFKVQRQRPEPCSQVLGQCKGVISAVVSVACFHNVVPALGWFGYAVTVVGCTIYGRCKAHSRMLREQLMKRNASNAGLFVDQSVPQKSGVDVYRPLLSELDLPQPSVSGSTQYHSVAHTRSGMQSAVAPSPGGETMQEESRERHSMAGSGKPSPWNVAEQRALEGAHRVKTVSTSDSSMQSEAPIRRGHHAPGRDGLGGSTDPSPREDLSSASSGALHMEAAQAAHLGHCVTVALS